MLLARWYVLPHSNALEKVTASTYTIAVQAPCTKLQYACILLL